MLGLGNTESVQYFPIKVVIDEENEDNLVFLDISAGRSHVGVIVKKASHDLDANETVN